jgi:alpha-galactosidase
MNLDYTHVNVVVGSPGTDLHEHAAALHGLASGFSLDVGPTVVSLDGSDDGFDWSVANRGNNPLALWSVAVVARLVDVRQPVRMFRHGYQSWSPAGVAILGVDADPSRAANLPFVQGVYHADGRQARDGELRSEWCTVLADDTGREIVAGFIAGTEHDGTFRLRNGPDGEPQLVLEAYLGGAMLAPGECRHLHSVSWVMGEPGTASEHLAAWAANVGRAGSARVDASFQIGWCSWYQFFHSVTEADLRRNLSAASTGGWPFDVIQLDDGYQAAIGDWRKTNAKFPSSLDVLAADISSEGRHPGLWLAPFLAAPDSDVAHRNPGWLARYAGKSSRKVAGNGEPLRSWFNPSWGGGEDGFMYSLDTTHPEVLEHLERLASDMAEAGFTYLKLDFTFAAAVEGRWHDPSRTPAQRVRAGFEAIRRGAGEDVFLLGCGVPMANVVGLVDANRIGPDVAPLWAPDEAEAIVPGYLEVEPATRSAFAATVARSFMHRQLWLNDPDCIMLRTNKTDLTATAARTWGRGVGVSGGLVLVSDDLALLGHDARNQLDEVVALARESDDAARQGRPPKCPDLMEHTIPTTLMNEASELRVDPGTASSTLERR